MKRDRWVENLFEPLVIGGMVACIAVSLIDMAHRAFPSWNGTFLVVGCVVAAVEASYSYRIIEARELRGEDIWRFRIAELGVFVILLKAASYIGDSWASVLADMRAWPTDPSRILDPETLAALGMTFYAWWTSTQTTQDLEQIGEPPEPSSHYVPPQQRITTRFYSGGQSLLIFYGLAHLAIGDGLHDPKRPAITGVVINALIYFLLGLVLLGQVRYTTLRRQWIAQKTHITRRLASRWIRYSLIFVSLASLIAFLLPTSYTVGLLDTVGTVLEWLAWIPLVLSALVINAIARLISRLSPENPPAGVEMPENPFEALGQSGSAEMTAPSWFDVARSLLFWSVLIGLTLYVVRAYLRDHPEILAYLQSLQPIQFLRRLWEALRHRWRGMAVTLRTRFRRPTASSSGGKGSKRRWGFLRLSALSLRERILYYYVSTLQRAGRRGFPRHQAQTPYEYTASLRPQLPEAQQEMDELTAAFVEARYSLHPIEKDQERRIQSAWQRVKTALRTLKRGRRQRQ